MPLPKPHKGETQDDFHSRCMGDRTMMDDFPDQAQRNAVCYTQWDEAHPENPHKKSLAYLPETAACWSNHLGFWCVEPFWFGRAVTAYKEGLWQPRALSTPTALEIEALDRRHYDVTKHGTAIIPLMGPLTKAGSYKFDGTSTVRTQRALRLALADEGVTNALLHIDSPGGHVAGIEALAGEVASFRGRKPIIAQIDDLGASAAYWVASQADAIYATATSEIGSIGTIAVVEDTSGRMDRLGVKVHVISTGPYKGMGAEGTPVTESMLSYFRDRVEAINGHFLQAVQAGRRLTAEQLALVTDGRVHIAATAQQLGLIDRVQSIDETLAGLAGGVGVAGPGRSRLAKVQARFAAWDTHTRGGGTHASHSL